MLSPLRRDMRQPPARPRYDAGFTTRLQAALDALPAPDAGTDDTTGLPGRWLQSLIDQGLDRLPLPGQGDTLLRWRALSQVAGHDLSLAKLYEGHTDAQAILAELHSPAPQPGSTWGTWAAEPPDARVVMTAQGGSRTVRLNGRKAWCSGAAHVSHGLLTVWAEDGSGPWLARVDIGQPGVRVAPGAWQSVGMAGSAAVDVHFDDARAEQVGEQRAYLDRPGFWQGGAGIAACWYGGARALGAALHRAVTSGRQPPQALQLAALGHVDLALRQTAAVLHDAASWMDAHAQADASALAMRARLSAETTAGVVLDAVGRALGAAPFCLDARFARMAADLPVFVRQSHAERDFAALGERVAAQEDPWRL